MANDAADPSARQVGDYTLQGELARGGMGVVYRALHGPTQRQVALKVILGEPDAVERERFVREAQATAKIQHPGVVKVHDAGVLQGRLYLAMELVPGESLQAKLDREGPLPSRRAAELTLRLTEAMAAAHDAGVLHRDLKPANVLLTPDDHVKLTDFGLARTRDSALTRTGEVMGTPGYMAPEQAAGERGRVDERTDIYGLGATLYALLCARPPFQGPTAMNVVAAVLGKPVTPPRKHAPDVDPALEKICLRCLAKSPQDRPPSAHALAEELEAYLAGEAPGVRVPLPALGAGLLALLLLAGGAWWALGSAPPRETPGGSTTPPRENPGGSTALTPKQIRLGAGRLPPIRDERSPEKKVEQAKRWLETFPGHPATDEVRALRDAAQLWFPLARGETPNFAHSISWLGERVLTSGNVHAQLWSPEGKIEREWPISHAPTRQAIEPRQRSALIWGEGPDGQTGVFVWLDPEADKPLFLGPVEGIAQVNALAYHPHEPLVAVGLPTEVALLEMAIPPRVGPRLGRGAASTPIRSLAWSPDGARLVIGRTKADLGAGLAPQPPVELWDVAGNERLETLGVANSPEHVLWSPRGDLFAVATREGQVLLCSAAGILVHEFLGRGVTTGPRKPRRTAHTGPVKRLTFDPDGDLLISVGDGRDQEGNETLLEIRAWDVLRKEEVGPTGLATLFEQSLAAPGGATHVELSSDGRRLLCAAGSGFQVWLMPERGD